ncbi:Protein MIZU-KUSSEI like [Actinidia chinensis var. chinensis]|uniref:Protein MIZU-KUSSEI like n=1 Tax=Actinidia chinensis var. chinensis TaxID=1590841 RepID=A0A2R6QI74_ACTCC|nr:Protein MIZU-KUSSEI like [Actinidia chinensis var. chinensis]
MKNNTFMAKSSEDLSSKRHFHWTTKITNEEEQQSPTLKSSNTAGDKKEETQKGPKPEQAASTSSQRRKLQAIAVSRLRSVLTAFRKNQSHSLLSLGPQVVGTLFGHRHGHVHMAFQKDAASEPAFLIELATPISGLVREMVSGLARIALECDKEEGEEEKAVGRQRLLEEPRWRTYCNGKKCGFAARRECGPREWKVLKAVEPISMGAGVLPGNGDGDGEIMYMRAKFERVVGSKDSEAFYMMNPDSNGAPELSIYLLRV